MVVIAAHSLPESASRHRPASHVALRINHRFAFQIVAFRSAKAARRKRRIPTTITSTRVPSPWRQFNHLNTHRIPRSPASQAAIPIVVLTCGGGTNPPRITSKSHPTALCLRHNAEYTLRNPTPGQNHDPSRRRHTVLRWSRFGRLSGDFLGTILNGNRRGFRQEVPQISHDRICASGGCCDQLHARCSSSLIVDRIVPSNVSTAADRLRRNSQDVRNNAISTAALADYHRPQ